MANEPTLTSKNLPVPGTGVITGAPGKSTPGAQQSPAAVVISDKEIKAKPLMDPQFTNVISKNPNLSFRWVMREDPGNRAGGTLRYGQMSAVGFEPATPLDCTVPGLSPRDNRWIYGDVILMKMPRDKYIGALKANEQNSINKVSARNLKRSTRAQIGRPRHLPDDSLGVFGTEPGEVYDSQGAVDMGPKQDAVESQ